MKALTFARSGIKLHNAEFTNTCYLFLCSDRIICRMINRETLFRFTEWPEPTFDNGLYLLALVVRTKRIRVNAAQDKKQSRIIGGL